MTSADRDIQAAIDVIRRIAKTYHVPCHILAKDAIKPNGAAISADYLYKILDPTYDQKPLPGGPVEEALFRLAEKLRVRYPGDCPTELKAK